MQITTIDTRVGTQSKYRFSNGNTLPLTGTPFAMNYFTVQNNGTEGSWFFDPQSRRFEGFRLTHQPSPWVGDFQHFQILPINRMTTRINEFAGSFDYQRATFSPSRIALHDNRYHIDSELTASTYGAVIRSHYEQPATAGIQFELPGKFELTLSEHGIVGWLSNFSECEDPDFKMYVAFHFSQPLDLTATHLYTINCEPITITELTHLTGQDARLSVFFNSAENELQLATSFISVEQAQLNLQRQLPKQFDQQLTEANQRWHQYLDRIVVDDAQHSERVQMFYTMLYRLFLFPQKFYELDAQQQPVHYDTKARMVRSGVLYTNNGFWDTYKTVYPLYSIIAPEILTEMLHGFLNSYNETGFLPKWLSPDERGMMPGTLIDAVIADAASKNLLSQTDLSHFLEAMLTGATVQSPDSKYGRRGTEDYLKYGYVPNTHDESVNHTLDYAYSDYCISVVAEQLGKHELAQQYRQNALNYRHLFDSDTQFIRAKDPAGHFQANFSATEWGNGYAEGSAWQNGFAVYQDIAGLAQLHGGQQSFYQKLVTLVNTPPVFEVGSYGFEIHEMTEMNALNFGQLAISNQPSFHIPYLFTYVDHPEMTQLLVKQLLMTAFAARPDGLPGDEDNGSMAGWYVLSALGFYPVTPGSAEYVLGMPLFDKVTLKLPDNQQFVIETTQNVDHHLFVKEWLFNQQSYTLPFITHQALMTGGTLTAHLGLAPSLRENSKMPFSISTKK